MVRRAQSVFCFFLVFLLFEISLCRADNFSFEGQDLGADGEGAGLAFVLKPGNIPAFSFFDEQSNALKYSEGIGSLMTTTVVDATLSASSDTALVFQDGVPHIIYFDSAQNRLLHASRNDGVWSREIIDNSSSAGGKPAVTPCQSSLCIAYYDAQNKHLRFAKGTTGAWSLATIDSTAADTGSMSNITLGASGYPVIAYYDATNTVPKIAAQQSNGSWSIQALSYYGLQFGMWPDIAVASDGTMYLVASSVKDSDAGTDDGTLWYATKPANGIWSITSLEWPFVGGSARVTIGAGNLPILVYRFQRYSGYPGSAVFIRTPASGNTWQWQALANGNEAFHEISRVTVQINPWGEPVVAYAFRRESSQQGPARSEFRIQAPKDSDEDGLPDTREATYGTNPLVADSDGDGLSDGEEVLVYGSNPRVIDTDGDGVPDDVDNCPTTPNPAQNNACVPPGHSSSSSSSSAAPDPNPAVDSDNDGLSDTEEIIRGTNPLVADTDSDGVADGQEITDGTNPLDRGSVLSVLGITLCSEWNGFLGMLNVLEHLNVSNHSLNVTSTLYDIHGVVQDRRVFRVAPRQEKDLLVHEMRGRMADSYGKICSTHDGARGDLDGRMVYYRVDPHQPGRYQFAFAMPFENGKRGEQFVPFNTFQPSVRAADQANPVANWIQVTNLNKKTAAGKLRFYNQNGQLLGVQAVSLAASTRRDFPAHQWGAALTGLVKWTPDRKNQFFQIRNVRYLYDNAVGENSFATAFQLGGMVGNGEQQVVLLDGTPGNSSVLEVINTKSSAVKVSLSLYADSGAKKGALQFTLRPFASRHIITGTFLSGHRGLAIIKGSKTASVVAISMQYKRDTSGGIASMYGVPATQALGSALSGSYNTFLNQQSLLWILNPQGRGENALISMRRSNGSAVSTQAMATGRLFSIPAHGVLVLNLSGYDSANNYGLVTFLPQDNNGLVAWVTRVAGNEFVIPTPVRQ